MFKTRKGLLLIILLLLASGTFGKLDDIKSKIWGRSPPAASNIHISEKRKVHILYGDKSGGGHKFGTGRACKSEFPKDWDDAEILAHVKSVAANDNLDWRQERNSYYTADDTVDGVKMRVVLAPSKTDVITAYPLNTRRNPCPDRKPANDNYND